MSPYKSLGKDLYLGLLPVRVGESVLSCYHCSFFMVMVEKTNDVHHPVSHNFMTLFCGWYIKSLGKKATIHQVTTMLATSKNVLFPGHFDYRLSTSEDDI